ncbi:MAG: carboxypeptidase-like regulatory domain-containing protein, partial [Ferruginibacter sp.]
MNKTLTQTILMFVVLIFTAISVQAQSTVVSGTVTDQLTKEPIPGASVTVKGKTVGTTTDLNGRFSFTTTEKTPFTLVASYI